MKKHQLVFEEIKKFLSEQFGQALNEDEEGAHLTIDKTGIWIAVDDLELTVGYEMNHRHYHSDFDDINEAINEFFNLLTGKKKITKYYKGKFVYKNKVEVENSKGEFRELSSSLNWFFPYWKKTQTKIEIEPSLIEFSKIENQILKIKSYIQNSL